MNQFLIKYKIVIFFIISISITTTLGIVFNLSLLSFILLMITLPSATIALLATPLVSKKLSSFINTYALTHIEEYERVEKYKKAAKLEGKRQFLFGKNKQHTVWSTTQQQASLIFNTHIKPLEKKYPKKAFYWIFPHCNNTKNGK